MVYALYTYSSCHNTISVAIYMASQCLTGILYVGNSCAWLGVGMLTVDLKYIDKDSSRSKRLVRTRLNMHTLE